MPRSRRPIAEPTSEPRLDPPPPGLRARVYALVRQIPAGKVLGYGHVAAALGDPRLARQVGYALAALPHDTDVPWQRVIRSSGSLALQGDPTRGPLQAALLREEGVEVAGDRVDMARFRWEPGAEP